MNKNLYEILEVDKTASKDEIKKSYRKLAMKWHPDKNQDNLEESEAKMKEITHAYYVLSDDQRRAAYDGRSSSFRSGHTFDNDFEQWYADFQKTADHELLHSITSGLVAALVPRSRRKHVQAAATDLTKVFSFFLKPKNNNNSKNNKDEQSNKKNSDRNSSVKPDGNDNANSLARSRKRQD